MFDVVGRTPLVHLRRVAPRPDLTVVAKLEGANAGGSVKDRVAVAMIRAALDVGRIAPGDLVVESSSGNMALALAQTCRVLGLRFLAIVDPGINPHTRRLLAAYGAEVEVVDDADDHGSHLRARLDRIAALVEGDDGDDGAFWPDQYASAAVPMAHRETMREVVEELGRPPDVLIVAAGTGGTLAGCADQLRSIGAPTHVVAVDAVGSRIFGGKAGPRHLPGHGSSRTSDLLQPGHVDEVVHVDDVAAVRGARRLLGEEGLLVGASSGAVLAALERIAPSIADDATVTLLLCDRGDRYLDTVFDDGWVQRTLGVDLSTDGAAATSASTPDAAAAANGAVAAST